MMAALVLASGGLSAVAGSAWPAGPAWGAVTTAEFDQAEEDLFYVQYLANYDPRNVVRTAAWNALAVRPSTKVPAAVDRFLNSGLAYAADRAQLLAARNDDFARRVLATHTAEFAPEVHAAAQYALKSGTAALEAFARTGYAAAKERDRTVREAVGEQAAALLQTDRDFVALLRDSDPGPQVRAAAGYALRAEATDADVVEFYAYDWAAAAAVDLQTQQIQCTNSDIVWRAGVTALLTKALAAQQAASTAEGEARALARASAAGAWHSLVEKARPARSNWDIAADVAQQQAANWEQVALAAAAAADNPNWDAITRSAQANGQRWNTEHTNAAKQAADWAALYDKALAGELANQP